MATKPKSGGADWGWRWRRLLTYALIGWLMWDNHHAIPLAAPNTVWIIVLSNDLIIMLIGFTYLSTASRQAIIELVAKTAEAGVKLTPQGGMMGMGALYSASAMPPVELPPESER